MDLPQVLPGTAALTPGKTDRRYLIAAEIIAVFALTSIPYRFISIFAPGLLIVMGGKQAALGILFTAASIGFLSGGLIGGYLSDRYHPWYIMRTALIALTALCFTALLLPSLTMLTFVVFGISMSSSAGFIAQLTLLRLLAPNSPRRIISLNFVVISVVGITIPIIAGFLFTYTQDNPDLTLFGMLKIVYASVGVLILLGLVTMPRPHTMLLADKTARPAARQDLKLAPSVFTAALLLGALHSGFDTTTFSWAPTFFTRTFAVRPFEPAWILSGYSLSYVIGRLLLTLLPEKKWERLFLIIPGIVGGTLLLFCFNATSYKLAAGLYVAASLCYGLELPVFLGALAKHAPQAMGKAIAVSATGGFAAGACLNSLVGMIGDASGSLRSGMLILPFGFILFGIVAWIWSATWRREKPGQ